MSCYINKMEEIFDRLDIDFTTKNKKEMNKLMMEFSHEENCPAIWKFIKPFVTGEESDEELIDFIKRHWGPEKKLELKEKLEPEIKRGQRKG